MIEVSQRFAGQQAIGQPAERVTREVLRQRLRYRVQQLLTRSSFFSH